MLKLKNIVKDYVTGDTTVEALKGVDIQFRESEFVSILGQSGCGKTTLLNIIGGLDRYTEGDLIINGKSTKDFKDKDWDTYRNHSIGFVFQSYNLIPHQTVLSNVELALTLSGVSKAERRKRAVDVLTRVGLGDQLHKKPNQMSGGQMQRVAIARALINDPDILLADEPTGALDSETSVQIMEILKEISADKLIIMVTHNPELAEKYSSRIIKLLDGKVTDDSDPYHDEIKKKDVEKDDRKTKKAKKKKAKKVSMSFFTALSLSKNNLLTKKGRTFLTSFAGSIGIIGIALILAVSNGVQMYIDTVQSDTLSNYPLQITKTSTSMTSMMSAMAEATSDEKTSHDKDKIYSQNDMGKTFNTLMKETKVNNLKELKKHFDNNDELKKYTTDVQYTYDTDLNIFRGDTDKGIVQVNPSTIMIDAGYSEDMLNMMSSTGTMQVDAFAQMINNDELIENQYDVVAGKLPEKWNELMLVVNENNEVQDYVLYTLGMLDKSKLKGLMKKITTGEKLDIEDKQYSFTYDEILNVPLKVMPTTDFYKKTDNGWENKKEDNEYMKSAINKAEEIKIVGIVTKSKDATSASIGAGIGYKKELMEHLLNKIDNSEIIKDQLANPETDVLTGKKFKTDEDDKLTAEQQAKANAQVAKAKETKENAENISQMGGVDMSKVTQGGKIDTSKLTDTQKKYMASLSDEQMALMEQMMKEQTAAAKQEMDLEKSDSTYENNLKLLGYAVADDPSGINIIPKDFESKEKIQDIINDYNKNATEENKIEYTDMVGLMMSSITNIIDAISYVLIAFVAISLIVSSIMIGIITYISVLERTKEIGILRSIGASKRDISRVFNAETTIVGLIAGLLGIGISYLLTLPINAIISHVTDEPLKAAIPPVAAIILVIISICLTLIAGLFPSKIAAKKDPVVALRTE